MAARTCSRLTLCVLSLAAAVCGGSVVVTTAAGEFHFQDVNVWKFSEARGEKIPALSGNLDNQTGKDWKTARFRVRAQCDGVERSYNITLRDLRPGRQPVAVTAYDAIEAVPACQEHSVAIDFLEGQPLDPAEAPAYVVLGFAYEVGASGWTTGLEGILDHRRPSQFRSHTRPLYWRDGGELLLKREGPEPVAFYAFRVDPGEMGLAGFTLTRDPNDTGPLARFLRFYMIPAGKASYLGVFRAFRGTGNETGVRLEFDPEAFEELQKAGVLGRPLIAAPSHKPMVSGSFTIGK